MDTQQDILFNAVAVDGASVAKSVKDYATLLIQLNFAGFTGTIKFVGSYQDSMPNFGSASSASNAWEYIKTIDVQDGAGINGAIGIPLTAITSTRMLEANTSRICWFGAIVSGRSAGTVTAKLTGIYKD